VHRKRQIRVKKKKAIETRPPRSPADTNGSNGHAPPGKYVGQPIKRREESRLVQGKGSFVDDKKFLGMAYMKLVRSPYAHARITHIDVTRAVGAPGVVCVLTGEQVARFGAGPVVLAVAHPDYHYETVLSEATRRELAGDLIG